MATALLLLVLGIRAPVDTPKGEAAAKELKKLEGTWIIASGEKDGKPIPERLLQSTRLVISGNKIKVFLNGKEDHEQTFSIDPGKDPKQIDTARELNGVKRTTQGIYAFEGDTLKLCGDDRGRERPAEFSTKGRPGYSLLVLKRKPPEEGK